jgi:undecaprenyl-diphosphatase
VVGCAVIVLIVRPAARAVAWVAAVVISLVAGVSRVVLGVHYVSDVVAGWILGMAIVLAAVSAAKLSVE